MREENLSESAKSELQKHLQDERDEIYYVAYKEKYANKDPSPISADEIAEAIAQIHAGPSARSIPAISALGGQMQSRFQRLRWVLTVYQLSGVLIGVGGLVYIAYQITTTVVPSLNQWNSPSLTIGFILSYLGFTVAFVAGYLGRRWIKLREERFDAAIKETFEIVKDRTLSAEASRFIWEWQNLERRLRTLYSERYGTTATGLRDMILSMEDIKVLTGYEVHRILENLRIRNMLIHGFKPGEVDTAELVQGAEEIRELRLKIDSFAEKSSPD